MNSNIVIILLTNNYLKIIKILQIFSLLFTDVDECSVDNGGCNETCNNSIGSFSCGCNFTGYEVVENSQPCESMYNA